MLQYVVSLTVFGAIVALWVRYAHRPWWRIRAVRWGLLAIVLVALTGFFLRTLGHGKLVASFQSAPVAILGALFAGTGVVFLLGLFFTLPVAALVRLALSRFRPAPAPAPAPAPSTAPAPTPSPALSRR